MRISLSVAISVALVARALARPAAVAGPSLGAEIRDTSIGAVDTHSPQTHDEFRTKFEMEGALRASAEADIAGLGKLLGAKHSGGV